MEARELGQVGYIGGREVFDDFEASLRNTNGFFIPGVALGGLARGGGVSMTVTAQPTGPLVEIARRIDVPPVKAPEITRLFFDHGVEVASDPSPAPEWLNASAASAASVVQAKPSTATVSPTPLVTAPGVAGGGSGGVLFPLLALGGVGLVLWRWS